MKTPKIVTIFSCLPLVAETAGTVSFKVTSADTGTPVAGISAVLVPLAGTIESPSVRHFNTDDKGLFLAPIPAGSYRVCFDEALGFADPCQWSQATVEVTAGKLTTIPVTLIKGIAVIVKLIDDGNNLARFNPAPPLSVILTDPVGRDHLVPYTGGNSNAGTFRLLVPPGKYQIVASTTQFPIADAGGARPDGRSVTALDTADFKPLPSWVPSYLRSTSPDERVVVIHATQ